MTASLPPELLDHVLSLAKGSFPTWEQDADPIIPDWSGAQDPNSTLLSAALVSKTWARSAQRALYRHAIFTNESGPDAYAAWIASAARSRHRTVSLWIRSSANLAFAQVIESPQVPLTPLPGMLYRIERHDSHLPPVLSDVPLALV
ncbi:hypothetical protein RQP46_010727 [Phenoliferia psychrophenolica]